MDENETRIMKHEQILAQYQQWLAESQFRLAEALAANKMLNEQLHAGVVAPTHL